MNRFTLKFKDDKVEQLFQRSRAEIKQKALEKYSPLVCLVTLLILANSILMKSLSICILSSIFLIVQMVAYYFILRKGFATRLQPIAMSIILSMSIILQIVAIIDDNMPHHDVDWIQDISLLLSINFVLSTDISWNFLFFTINLGLRLYIRYTESECFSILSVAFIICSLISFYNEYLRILRLRLEFELEEENQCSHNIFETFEEKNIIILKYDHETLRFSLKFQNSCSIKHFQRFTNEFLYKIVVGSENLGKSIFQSIKAQNYLVQKIVGKYDKCYYNITYQVTKYTELQIFIVITKKILQKYQFAKNQMTNFRVKFYRNLLKKIRNNDKLLYYQQCQKTLLAYVLFRPELLNLQITILNFEMFYSICHEKNIKARIQCFKSSIFTNIPLLDSLINLLRKMYQIKLLLVEYMEEGQNLKITLFGQKRQFKKVKYVEIQNSLIKRISQLIYISKWQIQDEKCQFILLNMIKYQRFKLEQDMIQ